MYSGHKTEWEPKALHLLWIIFVPSSGNQTWLTACWHCGYISEKGQKVLGSQLALWDLRVNDSCPHADFAISSNFQSRATLFPNCESVCDKCLWFQFRAMKGWSGERYAMFTFFQSPLILTTNLKFFRFLLFLQSWGSFQLWLYWKSHCNIIEQKKEPWYDSLYPIKLIQYFSGFILEMCREKHILFRAYFATSQSGLSCSEHQADFLFL